MVEDAAEDQEYRRRIAELATDFARRIIGHRSFRCSVAPDRKHGASPSGVNRKQNSSISILGRQLLELR